MQFMKLLAGILSILSFCVACVMYNLNPEYQILINDHMGDISTFPQKLADSFNQNPIPVILSSVGFLITITGFSVLKYIGKLKSKIQLQQLIQTETTEHSPIIVEAIPSAEARAKNKVVINQLIYEEIHAQQRLKMIPTQLKEAEIEASYAQKQYIEAEKLLEKRKQAYEEKERLVKGLKEEKDKLENDLDDIQLTLAKYRSNVC